MTDAEKKLWKEHNARYPTPDKNFFRNYPKQLPGGQLQRVLGRTHAGKTGLAINATSAAVGGAAGYGAYQKIKKNDNLIRARDGLQSKLDSMPKNPTEGSNVHRRKVGIQQQIDQINQKINAGVDVQAENAANKQPKAPPKPQVKPHNPFAIKTVARGMTQKGFYVPAAAIAGAGAIGYEANRRKINGNH